MTAGPRTLRSVCRSLAVVTTAALALAACGAATPEATAPTSGLRSTTTSIPSGGTPTTATPTTTPTAPSTAAPAGGLRAGPGHQTAYTVQPQPAPGTCHYSFVGPDPLPDPSCTPGAVDPAVTQADIATTICSSGWTSTVRPSTAITSPEKRASAAAYGYDGPSRTAEYDHLVPLELGGDPDDPANLWLEPNDRPGATSFNNSKDGLEDRLNHLVCSGQLPLAAAQEAIATDWVTALHTYDS